MLAQVETCTVRGIEAVPIRVEVSLSSGLPSFTVVGLAQSAVREGRERVGAALRNAGFGLPHRRITVNLAPADVRKTGTGFDLPIAVGILAAAGEIPATSLAGTLFLGELGLGGALRAIPGVIPAALLARASASRVVVPATNEAEARLVPDVEVVASASLSEVVGLLGGRLPTGDPEPDAKSEAEPPPEAATRPPGHGTGISAPRAPAPAADLADVRGQGVARRALEIVATGSHNLLMVGPPGVGKTMLARRLPGILPPMTADEALDLARIRSVAGLPVEATLPARPFRAPHHSVSYAGLVGGGTPLRPGEISLAHHGVLFLDELPEFRRDALEVLRQPLEEGAVALARAEGAVRFPARFLLVAAMNPCPCGHLGDGSDRCLCDDGALARYRRRVSGPLLDRIDLVVETPRPGRDRGRVARSEPSAAVAARVRAARAVQSRRFSALPDIHCNAQMGRPHLEAFCALAPSAEALLERGSAGAELSLRGRDRLLRVARTVADLEASVGIEERHLAEALQYRWSGWSRGRASVR